MHIREPRTLPSVVFLLDDLGGVDAVARYLHASPRTVARWRADNAAPRAAHLALYWVSRWGISMYETTAHNAAVTHAGHAAAMTRECDRLRGIIAKLEARTWDSANSPVYAV
jgi:hypothetical protein